VKEISRVVNKRRNKMAVKVNDSCIACGACESICDAVFSIEDKAVVNDAAVADNIDGVKEAADACPVGAIEVE
jgi:ferredoxin